MAKRSMQLLIFLLLMSACLFLSAGRWNWADAWLMICLYIGTIVMTGAVVIRKHPDLAVLRAESGKGAKDWDKVLAPLVGAVGPIAIWIVGGLDERFGWTHPPSPESQIAGTILFAAGCSVVIWAMASNNYFSSVVRIQHERGHTVATHGPYQYVRHPGYTGMIAFTLAIPLILGSYAAFIPAMLTVAVLILRTALEDHTLQHELDGYSAYAGRVRFRLVPIVW